MNNMPFYKNKKIIFGVIGLGVVLLVVFIIAFFLMSKPVNNSTINPPVSLAVSLPVSEPVVSSSRLELLHPEKFGYSVINSSADCPIIRDGFESYLDSKSHEFLINRKEINITEKDIMQYNSSVSLIKGEKTYEDSTPSPFFSFAAHCGDDLQPFATNAYLINYPNADRAIVVPSIDTVSEIIGMPEILTVRILGMKGNDIFLIRYTFDAKDFFTQEEIDSCPRKGGTPGSTDFECIIKTFYTNSTKQKNLIQRVESEVVSIFEIKP